jgi:DNA-binding MarR family transcriptional regulator
MTSHIDRAGPSTAAIRRMNRVLLALVDNDGSWAVTEIRDLLSEPMTRRDLESAIRRLVGANQVEREPRSENPARWRATTRGRDIAARLVARGESY